MLLKRLILVLLLPFPELTAQPPTPYAPELFGQNLSGSVCGFSPDGTVVYFVRQDPQTRQHFLYTAERSGDTWGVPSVLPFSGANNDVGGRLSRDGRTFYFTSDRPGGSDKPGDSWNIWRVEKKGEQWGVPTPLKVLNNKGMECCPVPWGAKKLLFSADRGRDHAWWISIYDLETSAEVFVDSLNADKRWQWPSSLAEGDVLLLNSMMRPDSKGMDDIYVSFFAKGIWSTPQNLGEPVNTAAYEDGAMLTPDKKWLIYSQHETAEAPSRVMMVPWKPIYEKLKTRQ